MHWFKFFLSLLITTGFIALLNTHHPFGSPVPPMGRLLNPFTGFWQNAEPQKGGYLPDRITLPGLKEPVEIVFDDRMVPHIFAANSRDAFYAQGYITAKFRLWQLDITARSSSGRLAEVVGEVALSADRDTRAFGIPWAAEREWSAWKNKPKEMEIFEAYSEGINAYLRDLSPADYPLEFKLLDYSPEEWTPLKSALVLKSMARTLCFRADDVQASNTLKLLGRERFDFLFPENNPKQSPIIPGERKWEFQPLSPPADSSLPVLGRLWQGPELPQPPPFLGSNNWAVAGSKTASGHPLLANDPHLQLTLPSIWFEIQMHTPEFNAYGVSLPGSPGIIIGFNENVAWGMTNVGQDVLDFYQIDWIDAKAGTYRLDGAAQQAERVEEKIRVRGRRDPVVDTVWYTNWGPVIKRFNGRDIPNLAMRWIAHDVPPERPFLIGGTFQGLMSAKNYDDYAAAIRGFDSPAQNFVFASRDGDIALWVNGKLPLKRREQGRFVQDGSRSANGWAGFLPRDHNPWIRNPERGFVASANQASADPSYPYYYNGGFDDYRGRIINRELEQGSRLTAEDMKSLQNNNKTLLAEEGLPILLRLLDRQGLSRQERAVIDTLQSWNYRFDPGARAPVAFLHWMDTASVRTFDEFRQWAEAGPVMFPERWRFLELLEQFPDDPIFDLAGTPARETAGQIVTQSFKEAVKAMAGTPGPWSQVKKTVIAHLGRIQAFSLPVDVGGFREAPNAISETNGPSWRMVVELGEEVKAYGVYPGGQSGNPGSPYYDQMLGHWSKGEYYALSFLKKPEDLKGGKKIILATQSR